jgi:hypothetical protein
MGLGKIVPDHKLVIEANVGDERPTSSLTTLAKQDVNLASLTAFDDLALSEKVGGEWTKLVVRRHNPSVSSSRITVPSRMLKSGDEVCQFHTINAGHQRSGAAVDELAFKRQDVGHHSIQLEGNIARKHRVSTEAFLSRPNPVSRGAGNRCLIMTAAFRRSPW